MKALKHKVPDMFGHMHPASSCCNAAIVKHMQEYSEGEVSFEACSSCHEMLENSAKKREKLNGKGWFGSKLYWATRGNLTNKPTSKLSKDNQDNKTGGDDEHTRNSR